MNRYEALKTLNNFQRVHLFAEVSDDGNISGGSNPEWITRLKKPAYRIVREPFLLRPLSHGSDLWSGSAERYGLDCVFHAKPLDQLVDDICDLYTGHYEDAMPPSHVMKLLVRLSQAGFFVWHEEVAILGSVRMNFVLNDFWLSRIGPFYVANDVDQLRRFGGSPTIVCSRSVDTVIERLRAYYDRPRITEF